MSITDCYICQFERACVTRSCDRLEIASVYADPQRFRIPQAPRQSVRGS